MSGNDAYSPAYYSMLTLFFKDGLTQIASVVFIVALVGAVVRKVANSRRSLPPGPPGNLLFGNSWPNTFTYRHFEKWTQDYGPVFSLRQGFTTTIIIGRMQAAVDILEKEGVSTSDRPLSIAASETLSGGMRVMHTRPGERLKKMRKALHTHLQPKSISEYAPILMESAKRHILDIIESPEKHQSHAKKYAASVVMSLAYGRHNVPFDDPVVQAVFRCLRRLGINLGPGLWKVDTYPFMRYIPGYLKELQDGYAEESELFTSQLAEVRQKVESGEVASQSFAQYVIERQQELKLSDLEAAYLVGGMFGAGSDTSASAVSISVLAAARYPEAQERVWEELDRVIGNERLPSLMDQDKLPQTMAWVLETFRWRPVTAGGLAHKSTKDIIWNGYVIPAGATIFGNTWSIGRDPEWFPDPERFDPQRWLKEDGQLRDDLKSYTFGFGRRVCPGQYLATASVFLNTALILWSFKVKEDPKSPIDEWAFTESINTYPLPFKAIFEPRIDLRELLPWFRPEH